VTPDQKLARIARSLKDAGIDALVMGGHAVRYYGIDRNTIDFDLVTSLATPEELRLRLPKIESLADIREEPVWRSRDFARFEIGRLPDGREEWLEFWLRNHLLADFPSLKARAEIGPYGGEQVAFLSIPDLLKSKETERESDWQDIALLEEVQDARNHASVGTAPDSLGQLLANLRSRRGMDRASDLRLLDDRDVVEKAVASCSHPATYAFLFPIAPDSHHNRLAVPVDPSSLLSLRSATFGSPKHFALVEICRRAYKRYAMDLDRADKQSKLTQRSNQP
jgi:hypothetical protein